MESSTPSETHTYDNLSEAAPWLPVQSPFPQPLTGCHEALWLFKSIGSYLQPDTLSFPCYL